MPVHINVNEYIRELIILSLSYNIIRSTLIRSTNRSDLLSLLIRSTRRNTDKSHSHYTRLQRRKNHRQCGSGNTSTCITGYSCG